MKSLRLVFTLLGSVALVSPSLALDINIMNPSGDIAGTPFARGFAIAAKYWDSVLTNNAILNIDVGLAPMSIGIVARATSTTVEVGLAGYEQVLKSTGTSALDAIADNHLPVVNASGSISVKVPAYANPLSGAGVATAGLRTAPTDGPPISSVLFLTSANYKALYGGTDASVDATITFSSNYAYDFNPTPGIATNDLDFLAFALHEIGHALGFDTGVDGFDDSAGDPTLEPDETVWGYGGDLFRYANGDLNWAFNQDSYFSIDGGATAFNNAFFSTGANNGDGYEASHWLPPDGGNCGSYVGVMNPFFCIAQGGTVTAADLAYLDAIGWNTNVDVIADPTYAFTTSQIYAEFGAVPETATWAMLALGFSACGAVTWARRERASA